MYLLNPCLLIYLFLCFSSFQLITLLFASPFFPPPGTHSQSGLQIPCLIVKTSAIHFPSCGKLSQLNGWSNISVDKTPSHQVIYSNRSAICWGVHVSSWSCFRCVPGCRARLLKVQSIKSKTNKISQKCVIKIELQGRGYFGSALGKLLTRSP